MRLKGKISIVIGAASAALLMGLATVSAAGGAVDDASEWRLLGRTPEMQHFSPLADINKGNVKRLGLAWFADVPTQEGLPGNALVADGVVYQSSALGKVWAHDVRTGKQLWAFDADVKFGEVGKDGTIVSFFGSRANRGLALLDDKVFIATGDCRLIAIDRARGAKVWETVACDKNGYYTITGAPRVGGGKVFIGNASMDSGASRGYVAAFDAKTGREAWRFYTVPGDPAKGFENEAMARAAKTWGKDYWKISSGGGSPWDAITYDPVLNTVYFGTDGPSPFNPQQRGEGRGDELYTNSIVAVDADTGAYRWHYQTTPNDAWNLSAAMHIMVAELPIGGVTRRVVMQAPKNGFFYVLDARSGQLLSAEAIVPTTWASRVDLKTGRPVENPEARYYARSDRRALVKPSALGAHSWQAMAYSAETGLVYIPAVDIATSMGIVEVAGGFLGGASGESIHVGWYDEIKKAPEGTKFGKLIAWDPVAGKARWTAPMLLPINGGVLATAGDLVFAGAGTGEISAYDAKTGALLWQQQTGSAILAAPTTVRVDGEQMLLVPVGTGSTVNKLLPRWTVTNRSRGPARLFAFKLGGKAAMPKLTTYVERIPKPPLPKFDKALAERGGIYFEQRGCDLCHGADAEGGHGSVPDLRKATAQTHALIGGIVIDGMRQEKGMPSFKDSVGVEELEAIQAYIINQAWEAYEGQSGSRKGGAQP
jgi:quinohemoprotein ethanol dehydrogenase